MTLLKQLLREFCIPLVLAVLWTVYNLVDQPRRPITARDFVNIFGPTFFFVSWIGAQWFRVAKQQRLQDGLSAIDASVNRTLDQLESRTTDLIAHITGGESSCYLLGVPLPGGTLQHLSLVHVGKHPLYEVTARIVDLEQFDQIKNNPTFENIRKSEIHRQCGNLIPGHATLLGDTLSRGSGDVCRFNVFFTARNGSFTQLWRFRRVNGGWTSATRIVRGDAVLFEQIQDSFPRNADGSVAWEA